MQLQNTSIQCNKNTQQPSLPLNSGLAITERLRPEIQLPGGSMLVPESVATQLLLQCRIPIHGRLNTKARHVA